MKTIHERGSGTRIALRVLTPVLIAGAFAGLAGATEVAAATAPPAAVKAASAHLTQGFDLRNLSSHTITLTGIDGAGKADGAPRIGSVLRPGDAIHYEKVFWFGNTPKTILTFNESGSDGSVRVFQIELWVDSFLNSPSIMMPGSDGRIGDIEVQGLGYTAKSVSFVDKFGSAPIEVPAADKQRQADLLNRLCADGLASCTFRTTSTEPGAVLVDRKHSEVNLLDAAYPLTITDGFTFTAATNVEASVSGKVTLFGLVDTTLSAKYGKSWSEAKTGTVSRTIPVKPGYRGYIELQQPTIRQHGDFTVTMGNTTWILTGVYFDIPDMAQHRDVVVGQEKYVG